MGACQPPNCEGRPHNGLGYRLAMPAKPRVTELMPAIGRRLRKARSILYSSSDACAKAFEVPLETWRHYEKGDRYPDPWHLVRFCDETGFTTDFIYRGRLRGIREDVQLRLAAEYPELVDEAPDVGGDRPSKVMVPA